LLMVFADFLHDPDAESCFLLHFANDSLLHGFARFGSLPPGKAQ
jgi:hypothetical protein